MTFPSFSVGETLRAADMNAVGLWRVSNCTVTSAGGTAATASNGVITVGTGNTSVTVSAAFSSAYDNYRIVISGGVSSANGSVSLKLNNSSGNTYRHFGYFGSYGTATLTPYAPAFGASWTDAGIAGTAGFVANIDLSSPFLTQATFGTTWSTSTNTVYNFALIDTSTASSTGFTVAPLSGTLTGGTIRVYGYNK